jgi:cytoskeletal protein CcmA (bactofilin family)
VVIAGSLEGDVRAEVDVVVTASGSLRGDVDAPGFVLEEGGQFHGNVSAEFDLPDALA